MKCLHAWTCVGVRGFSSHDFEKFNSNAGHRPSSASRLLILNSYGMSGSEYSPKGEKSTMEGPYTFACYVDAISQLSCLINNTLPWISSNFSLDRSPMTSQKYHLGSFSHTSPQKRTLKPFRTHTAPYSIKCNRRWRRTGHLLWYAAIIIIN